MSCLIPLWALCDLLCERGNKTKCLIVLSREKANFVKNNTDSNKKYSESDVFKILKFLFNNNRVETEGHVLKETIGILIGKDFALLLVDILLHSYEASLSQVLLQKKMKRVARPFNFSFRYTDCLQSTQKNQLMHFRLPHT